MLDAILKHFTPPFEYNGHYIIDKHHKSLAAYLMAHYSIYQETLYDTMSIKGRHEYVETETDKVMRDLCDLLNWSAKHIDNIKDNEL